jgi:putative peptidoglycan lipid II flippase
MLNVLRAQASRWWNWRNQSTNRQIFAAIATIGFGTLMVKVAAVAKELVIAYQFGTSNALDAFLIAYLLPSFAITVVAGSVSSALIPTYVKVRERDGREQAYRLLGTVLLSSLVFLLLLSAALAAGISYLLPVLASGFDDEKLQSTLSLFFIILPVLLVTGMAMIWTSVLNAGERFALAATVPLITPMAIIVALFALTDTWDIYALAAGTLIGALAELAMLVIAARRLGIPVRPRWNGLSEPLKQVSRQYVPMVAGAFLMSGTFLVDQAMAAMLSPGSVSAYNYGCKVVYLLIGIMSVALGSAVLPYFSKMVARADWQGIQETLKYYGGLILGVGIPTTLLLMYFSEPLIELMFQRGQFNAEDTQLATKVQFLYAPQIPFYLLSILFVRLVSSLKGNYILMWIAAINLCTNILFNYLFMQLIGLPGIALSTSIVYVLSTAMVMIALHKLLKNTKDESSYCA